MENVEDCDKLEKCVQIHLKHVGWPYKAFPQTCSFQSLLLLHGAPLNTTSRSDYSQPPYHGLYYLQVPTSFVASVFPCSLTFYAPTTQKYLYPPISHLCSLFCQDFPSLTFSPEPWLIFIQLRPQVLMLLGWAL
uniref:Uncharacterized protein n=1 Tax=Myotis myotis TaxID=51298 RepID=A0A7J7Z4L5_MYOMY|nr:hypothetical protein mMyoMyo1_010509 [Myotis myotis]